MNFFFSLYYIFFVHCITLWLACTILANGIEPLFSWIKVNQKEYFGVLGHANYLSFLLVYKRSPYELIDGLFLNFFPLLGNNSCGKICRALYVVLLFKKKHKDVGYYFNKLHLVLKLDEFLKKRKKFKFKILNIYFYFNVMRIS